MTCWATAPLNTLGLWGDNQLRELRKGCGRLRNKLPKSACTPWLVWCHWLTMQSTVVFPRRCDLGVAGRPAAVGPRPLRHLAPRRGPFLRSPSCPFCKLTGAHIVAPLPMTSASSTCAGRQGGSVPEPTRPGPQCLVVLACEIGGREGTRSASPTFGPWSRRCWGLLGCAQQRAVGSTRFRGAPLHSPMIRLIPGMNWWSDFFVTRRVHNGAVRTMAAVRTVY